MADVTEVTTSYTRKIQLEQFEPISHSATLTVELDEGDDPNAVYDEYSERVEDMVERQLAARLAQKKLDSDGADDTDSNS